MTIEDRDTFLVRAEVQRRQAAAAQERLARTARREQAEQARAAETNPQTKATTNRPGFFGWLRRVAQ